MTDKIRKYRADYNNNNPDSVVFMSDTPSTSGRFLVNLSDFYSYTIIGKLTTFFLQLQEFRLCNPPVDYSTSTTRFSFRFRSTVQKQGWSDSH
jgi:hypothetical protein